ncbi:ATP-binding protein [Actinotignum sp. GS-2025c]|uniref:ATP-binding protein n=1 Tax=Actinotignum sp. GS-2025c TaxID=3427276 RepID=UPI003F44C6B7
MNQEAEYQFVFSLTTLDHLGRGLYRNFITILGEAISNAWDADATNVWITFDRKNDVMTIKDDGIGMTSDDIQNKFLKIGYSKRKERGRLSGKKRPFIGAKGIGKLALLSCADKVTVSSKPAGGPVSGCVIDNQVVDNAIVEDKTQYELNLPSITDSVRDDFDYLKHGTLLKFEGNKAKNSTDIFLRKALALDFRFSLLDPSFTIFFKGKPIGPGDARELSDATQFLWRVGKDFEDPFVSSIQASRNDSLEFASVANVRGFIASVRKPESLNVFGTGKRIGVDLFVNGRLRERDILSRRPSARVPEQYLYGQIHLDALDGEFSDSDPFTSSREGVQEDEPLLNAFLDEWAQDIRRKVYDQWDKWRLELKEEGDPEQTGRRSAAQRAADKYIKEENKEFAKRSPEYKDRIVKELENPRMTEGLHQNLAHYGDLYRLENLVRDLHRKLQITLSERSRTRVEKYRNQEKKNEKDAGYVEPCRTPQEDLYYLGFTDLLKEASSSLEDSCVTDDFQCKISPLRNIVMHTAQLTPYATRHFTENTNKALVYYTHLAYDLNEENGQTAMLSRKDGGDESAATQE